MAEVIGTDPPSTGPGRPREAAWAPGRGGRGLVARVGGMVIALDPSSLTRQRPRLVSHALAHPWACLHTLVPTHTHLHTHAPICSHTGTLPGHTHSHTHAHTVLCFECTLGLLIIDTLARYSNHSNVKYRYVGDEEKVHVDLRPAGRPRPLRGKRREHGPLGAPRPGGATVPSLLPGLGPKSSSHSPPRGRHPGPKTELTKKINFFISQPSA